MKWCVRYRVQGLVESRTAGPYEGEAEYHLNDIATYEHVHEARLVAADLEAHEKRLSDGDYGPTEPVEGKITVGCWVTTVWGPAVCCCVRDNYVSYRYRAFPFKEGKLDESESMWVANGDAPATGPDAPDEEVRYLGPPDEVSRLVVLLGGPYGRAWVSPENLPVW